MRQFPHNHPLEVFELSDVEVETLRRAAIERGLPFDKERRSYQKAELARYGMVRESYTRAEMSRLGFRPGPVSCFDDAAKRAEDSLRVEAPFGSGITKWQLPINTSHMMIEQTVFPPSTVVTPHVHPENSPDDTGGGLRIVTKGKVYYSGKEYGPGDWFFIPNGIPYSFTTDPSGPTVVMYKYGFFGVERENRFSHPSATHDVRSKERRQAVAAVG
jgi:quercetin dioxygenase-like cupin family protein